MRLFLFFLILFFSNNLFSTSFLKEHKKQDKKLNKLVLYEIGTYSLGLVAMNELWYKNYPKSDFHFINDNSSWLQMDKMGHVATSYYSGINGIKLYRWAGVEEKKAIWFGGLRGTFYNSIVEVLDGFSKNWGAKSKTS